MQLPWSNELDIKNQPRYARNVKCKYWSIFQGLNDWIIGKCQYESEKKKDDEMFEELAGTVLEKWAYKMAQEIEVDNIGAFTTEDEKTEGYYMVQWCSEPYTAQYDMELMDYKPPTIVPAGELICDAYWLNPVHKCKYWYTASHIKTVVIIKKVVASNVEMLPISDENPLPLKGKARTHPVKNDAKRIRNKCVDEIVEEIARRDRVDYTELMSVTNIAHSSEDKSDNETASDDDSDESDDSGDGDDGDDNTDMED